jgi:hypothetical protein
MPALQGNAATCFLDSVIPACSALGRRLKPTLLKGEKHTDTVAAKHCESRCALLGAQAGMPVLLKGSLTILWICSIFCID